MNIGVDIDGVLYPWDEVARDVLVERFGIERPGPSTCWSYLKDVLPGELWRWLWSAEGQEEAFSRTWVTYPGATDAINGVLKLGHSVHFVTHRDPRRTAVWTARFLARHFYAHPWAGVHVVQASVAKRRLLPWDVFVDDKPDTVFDFLANTGAMVFSPVRPWNVDELEGVAAGGRTNLVHYTDPEAILEWVGARS